MTTYRIEWRPRARADLRAIVLYIGKDNPRRAESFGKEIRDKLGLLAEQPKLGKTGRLPGIRELVVHRNYIVFYRVLAETSTVEIVSLKHAAQQEP